MRPRRLGLIRVPTQDILRLLKLPENLQDAYLSTHYDFNSDSFNFVLEHDTMPVHATGEVITYLESRINPDGTVDIVVPANDV